MSGETFRNNIDQGQSGPDDGSYGAAMESGDPDQVTAAMDAVAQAEGLKNIPSSHVTEGTKFGVNAELEVATDKILAEADTKEPSAPAQEPVQEVTASAPAIESPAPTPLTAETPAEVPVAEAKAEQPAAKAQAPIAPENTDINLAGAQREAKSAEKKIECFLPDGSRFTGTPEEYNKAVKDYLDNIRN